MRFERLDNIMEILQVSKSITLDKLCEQLKVSKNTIRRDIAQLEEQGKIKKFYGGIRLQTSSEPVPFTERASVNSNEKKLIAEKAASMVEPGDVIFIDSGTTTKYMIPLLAKKEGITVVTASVEVISAATKYNLNLICTGGTLYTPSKSFVGNTVTQALSQFNIHKAFMSSSGVSQMKGVTNANPLECDNKKVVMRGAAEKILLIDHSKFGKSALMIYADLGDFDKLITDELPNDDFRSYCKSKQVEVIKAQ